MAKGDKYNVECIKDGVIISRHGRVEGYHSKERTINFHCHDRDTAVLIARIVLGEWEELSKQGFDLIFALDYLGCCDAYGTDDDEYSDIEFDDKVF